MRPLSAGKVLENTKDYNHITKKKSEKTSSEISQVPTHLIYKYMYISLIFFFNNQFHSGVNKSSKIVYLADKLFKYRYLAIALFNYNELQSVWKTK